MPVHAATLDAIEEFLSQKRIALVGLSRNPHDFSVMLFQEMTRRGYEVVPVNPNSDRLHGQRCYARVQDIQPPVDTVLLMTAPDITDAVLHDCAAAGVHRVWLYRAGGKGAVSSSALQICEEFGMLVVPGQCPYMFWRDAGIGHRLHGFVRKITGRYPKHALTA